MERWNLQRNLPTLRHKTHTAFQEQGSFYNQDKIDSQNQAVSKYNWMMDNLSQVLPLSSLGKVGFRVRHHLIDDESGQPSW